ncbi:MAG: hypothetical protein ABJA66_09060 [Actinomycetota bacterium]
MLNPETRISELSRLGFSQPILELSSGRKPHPIFEDTCNDPYYIYLEGSFIPFDLRVIPLWEAGIKQTAVWEKQDRIEIIEFSLESPEEYEVIAYSEQGLWAYMFAYFIDDWVIKAIDMNLVIEAADAVKFLFLNETIDFIRKYRDSDEYPEVLTKLTKSI